jgi:FKBP-type peptidyl-prolyl cis-trans isomerase
LPKSRKRKTRRGGGSSRSTHSKKNKPNQMTKAIAFLIIAALAVAAVLFIIFRGGGGSTPGEVTTASGLKYIDEVVGTGDSPTHGQNVTVHYTGTLENGTKFDSSFDRGQPYTFRLGVDPMIKGWVEALMTMKPGGKRRLIVPANLGYGAAGRPPDIPPNVTLKFEVELLSVN